MSQTSTAALADRLAAPAARLSADNVTVGYGDEPVVHDVSLRVPDGKVTTIIGPNGCGKSTLLRTLSRLLTPTTGQVMLDGDPIGSRSAKQLARTLALLPQSPIAPEGLLVRGLVGRGRPPPQRWVQPGSHGAGDIGTHAMRGTG
ncbi:ATP-binding cassette domain-containing protein, partial [Flexivirga sp.]|uniref:ATP-binding cassette domain-containing protein n=1 Tax=Flexivirga sp. TaxID=1962927 RepID=UPI003F81D3D9